NCSGDRPLRTSSTICRLNSGVYLAIVDSFPNPQVSTKSGQLQPILELVRADHQSQRHAQ
ncbi:MAG: hypothetical protein ACREQV_10875, partial [Candidatus Binatia bacterium]